MNCKDFIKTIGGGTLALSLVPNTFLANTTLLNSSDKK